MKIKHKLRFWLLMLLCSVAILSNAQSVNIQGLGSSGTIDDYPFYFVNQKNIIISSSTGNYFNHIYIDEVYLEYVSFLHSYTLDISQYLDGETHKLELTSGEYNRGICYFSSNVDSFTVIDDIIYTVEGETAKVTGTTKEIETADIFAEIAKDGVTYPVTEIAYNAFYNHSNLTSIYLPESITTIGDNSFKNCNKLKSVVLPKNVTEVALYCFEGCNGLTKSAYPSTIDNPFINGKGIAYPTDSYVDESGVIYSADKSRIYFVPLSIEGDFAIPETVTEINDYAFYYNTLLTSITFPESVTSIGTYAFYGCSSLTSVVLPKNLSTVGLYAFTFCSALVKSAYPSTINNPFSNNGRSLPYPQNCYVDENGVIYNSDKTQIYFAPLDLDASYVIPTTVSVVSNYAFYKCLNLTSIVIPEAITDLGYSTFEGCDKLTDLEFNAENCTYCGSSSNPVFPSSVANLTMGNKVTKIPDYFLYLGNDFESLTIPNSVTSIGSYAFYRSNRLKSLTIGSSVTSIGTSAFTGSRIIKTFWLANTRPSGYSYAAGDVNYVSNDQYSFTNQKKYQFLSSKFTVNGVVYIPISPSDRTCDAVDCVYSDEFPEINISDKVVNRGVEMAVLNINQYAFYDNDYTTKINVSNNGPVGDYAFYDCDSIETLEADNNGNIGYQAFFGCDNLQSVIATNKGSIGNYAFRGCDNLQTATLANDDYIGENAFSYCKELKSVNISNNGFIASNAFNGCSALETAYIANNGSIYQSAFENCKNLKTATILNKGYLGRSAFYDCSALEDVTLGENITEIGVTAFANCSSIPSIVIPNSVTSLRDNAFQNCGALESVVIGSRVQSLPYSVFTGCYSLGSIVIPSNINSIGDYAFSSCIALSDITFEDADKEISLGSNGNNPLFKDCPLDEVYIGRKLSYQTSSSYGYSPFYRNTSLRTVEITDAETQIYDNEFYGCTNLSSLKIGNGVKTIGKWAFSGCSSLDYFSAGYNVESIGQEAFSDCSSLTKFYSYSVEPPVCGDQALDDINKWDCTLFVPNESSDEYRAAPQWKDFFFIDEMDAVLVAELRLNLTELNFDNEVPVQLSVEVLPANAADKEVEWLSSDESVVTVSDDGLVTPVADGTATIIVRSKDGNAETTCSVTVNLTLGIGGIALDSTESIEVYNLNGLHISDSIIGLPAGIYIVRQGASIRKVTVK